MTFEIFKDRKGQFRFRMKGANHKVILQSEGYKAKRSAFKPLKALQNLILDGRADQLKVKDLTV